MPCVSCDVLRPARVPIDRIDAEPDDLDAALVELRLDARHVAELGGTHRREVLGVRKHHAPGTAEPLVKADRALGGLRFEVGGISCRWVTDRCS